MSNPKPSTELQEWPLVGTEPIADCRVFSVSRSWVRVPGEDPRSHPFYRIDANAWVNVIPLTADDEVVMVRQYRHGVRGFTLEIPGGIVDSGESPAEAAARELLEETGYRAGGVRSLGSLNPNPALFGNRVHTFLAEGCERVADIANPGMEETAVCCVPRRDLDDRVRAGDIDHALVIAALHCWSLDRAQG